MMKLSCLPVSIYKMFDSGEMTIARWADEAARTGFDAFDLGEGAIAELGASELETIGRQCSIPFHMLSAYTDFTNPDDGVRAEEVQKAKEKIEKTMALGGRLIRLPGGPAYPQALAEPERTVDRIYECFSQCVPYARKCGVRIVFENDSQPASWKYPNFGFDVDRFCMIWAAIGDLDIGFNFDTGNAYFLGNWQGILNSVLGRIESIHITDYDYTPGDLKMTVAGNGTVPIEEMLTIIRDSGYDADTITMEDVTFDGLKGIKNSYQYTRRICDKVFGI